MPPRVQQATSGIVRQVLERQRHAPARKPVARTVRPFDQDQRARAEDLVPRERVELLRTIETVEVEVVDGRSRRLVLLNERERRDW
jgi:hypothetical protein